MINYRGLTALSLTALVVSTSIVSAGGFQLPGIPKTPIVIDKPIVVDFPPKPHFPIIILDDGVGSKPKIPIIPVNIFDNDGSGGPSAPRLALDCDVLGPDATTDDFWIVNTGEAELPAGLKIRFKVPSTGDHGAFLLPRPVPVGKTTRIGGLLHAAEAGAPCTAGILS